MSPRLHDALTRLSRRGFAQADNVCDADEREADEDGSGKAALCGKISFLVTRGKAPKFYFFTPFI